jgi:hypothetical protein
VGKHRFIRFKCPDCLRHYKSTPERVGEKFLCPCGRELDVPAESDLSDHKPLFDRILAFVLFGLCGAFFGALIGLWIALGRDHWHAFGPIVGVAALIGFLLGGIGGERVLPVLTQLWYRGPLP